MGTFRFDSFFPGNFRKLQSKRNVPNNFPNNRFPLVQVGGEGAPVTDLRGLGGKPVPFSRVPE